MFWSSPGQPRTTGGSCSFSIMDASLEPPLEPQCGNAVAAVRLQGGLMEGVSSCRAQALLGLASWRIVSEARSLML